MPLDPEIIFKLTIDDSGYIVGVNNMTATTQKLVDAQRKANQELIKSQNALATSKTSVADLTAELERAQKANDANAVADLTGKLKTATDAETKLTAEVLDRKAAYDAATKAAQDFYEVEQKAPAAAALPTPGTTIQQQQLDLFTPPVLPAAGTQLDLGFQVEGIQAADEAVQELQQSLQDLKDIKEQALASGEDQSSPQFVELNQLIAALEAELLRYNKTLEETGNTAQETGEKHTSLRTQLSALRNEMALLTEQGKENTEQFKQTAEEAGHLSRIYHEQQERIRFLSSEHKALDFGKAALHGAIGGYQALISTQVLFGEKNEELEKQTLKLFAAMQLLNGVEEILALTRRSSTVAIGIETAATAVYTAVVGAATGATQALRVALLATGIGAIVGGLFVLISLYNDFREAQEKANAEAKLTKEINDKAIESYAGQVANLEILKRELSDLSKPQAERIALAREYNKTAEEGNRIDLDQIDNTQLLTTSIDAQADAIRNRAIAKAAENANAERATNFLKLINKLNSELAKTDTKKLLPEFKLDLPNIEKQIEFVRGKIKEAVKEGDTSGQRFFGDALNDLKDVLVDIQNANEELKVSSDLVESFRAKIKPPELPKEGSTAFEIQRLTEEKERLVKENDKIEKDDIARHADNFSKRERIDKRIQELQGKEVKTAAEVQNTFIQQRDALNRQLAELESNSKVTLESITKKFDQRLTEEKNKLEQEVKKGSITKEQSGVLLKIFVEIDEKQKDLELAKLSEDIFNTQQKLTDEINTLQNKAQTDTINNIQDEFTKRAAFIEANELNERVLRKKAEDKAIEDLNEARRQELITDADYYIQLHQIITAGEVESTAITQKFALQRQELSVSIFRKSLEVYEQIIKESNFALDRSTSKFVTQTADKFLSGKINFSQFKKQTENFQADQEISTKKSNIRTEEEILRQQRISLATRTDRQTKSYQDDFRKAEEQEDKINNLKKDESEAEVERHRKVQEEKAKNITAYADAVGSVAQSVIGAWQAANAAEAQALDRSIVLQQRRVDEAQRIADKGNAQYLKSETDRLKQLEVERENSARRQLGIDAALQAAQLLTGITGAIAKIGTGIGAAETVAEIAVIIGALATGYGLVKQLQSNQPRLKEGTPYVQRGPNKPGVDTIPAWLNEGEAVIPTERNRKYSTAVKAIYDEKIPADVLNSFVSKYSKKSDSKKEVTVVDKVLKGETITADFINNVSKKDFDEKSKLVYTLQNLTKRFIGADHDKSFLSTLKADEVKNYNEIITRSIESHVKENKMVDLPSEINSIVYRAINPVEKSTNQKTYESFVRNINRAPEKTVKEFIRNYEHSEMTKAVKETAKQVVKKESLKDSSVLKILPVFPAVNFSLKPVPQPNYEHIQTVNEMKLGQDGKLRQTLEQQNSLLKENNEHQKETQRLLKSMGVSVNIDENGVSAMVMKAIEQKKIYSKI